MITHSAIYWLTRLDEIKRFLSPEGGAALLIFISMVLTILLFCLGTFTGNKSYEVFSERSDEEFHAIQKTLKRYSALSAKIFLATVIWVNVAHIIRTFIPSSKDMAAILVIPKIANSESVQTIGTEIVDLAKEWLQELHPKKDSAKGE